MILKMKRVFLITLWPLNPFAIARMIAHISKTLLLFRIIDVRVKFKCLVKNNARKLVDSEI